MANEPVTMRYLDPEVLRRLAHIELRARLLVEGMYASRHRSPHYGYSVEFKDHREYVVGDEPKNIDWKMLARTERYYVKRFEMESNMDVIAVVDTSASMGYQPTTTKRLTKMEYACYLAASLSYLANRQQDAPGLITFDDELQLFIGPRQGMHHLHTLLARLETLKSSRQTDLGAVLRRIGQRLKRRSLLILISDCHSNENDVRDGIRQLAARGHDVVVMHLLDHDEIEFPFQALSAFADLETSGEVMCDPLRQRTDYLRRLQGFRDSIMEATVGCGADYRFIDTAEPIEIILRDYLLYRRQRG